MSKAPAIGIDLGTTFSCVAVCRNDAVEVIPDEQGNKTTPSMVAFTEDDGCVVGEAAKNQISENPENTIFDIKRLIGRRWDDPVVQEDKENWPFKVLEKDDRPAIEVEYQDEMKTFYAEEISARVLIKLKDSAEEYLGKRVEDAVITVPAYFTNAQREATKNAANIAGLNVLSIINEPTAAAIAYGFDRDIKGKRTVLVYDLGGGTFDVSLLKIVGSNYEVLATAGNNHLGGIDFDRKMVGHFVNEIMENKKVDIRGMKRSMNVLREHCETAKRMISSSGQPKSTVVVDNLYNGEVFRSFITKGRFNELNEELFQSTLEPLRQVMADAKISPEDIDDVVLAGGSTRIPRIRELLSDFFDNKPIAAINPDEIVARGAAIRAAAYDVKMSNLARLKDFVLTNINSLSLGIETKGGVMSTMIERNTKLPVSVTKVFQNAFHNQKMVDISVFEGESPDVTHNTLLEKFDLHITPKPVGETMIDVYFKLDTEGILHVNAKDRMSGKENSIRRTLAALSDEDLDKLLAEAEKFREEDKCFKANVEEKLNLDKYCHDANYRVDNSTKVSPKNKRLVIEKCNEVVDWILDNKLAPPEAFQERLEEMKQICGPILQNL